MSCHLTMYVQHLKTYKMEFTIAAALHMNTHISLPHHMVSLLLWSQTGASCS